MELKRGALGVPLFVVGHFVCAAPKSGAEKNIGQKVVYVGEIYYL